ncbi:hypothetical protein QBC46DRAFT_80221 [Diplogelasinospora grovesii]|uniref:Uncharacterized protein n=1 Tax=Diplogelasinospora grovesii TaxID=303347 RepID=A0AAN6MVS7_9PEZI|nr:hypothetical protein QBC46DRAFT_80221 [Diplogelasinospora grovesii]
MAAKRIDNFVGDVRAYAGYLVEVITKLSGISLDDLINQLEEGVKVRRGQYRTSSLPNTELDDEVQAADRARIELFFETRRPTLPPSLDIEIWDPAKSPPPVTSCSPVWKDRTASFFASLPNSEDLWCDMRESVGFSDAHGILRAVDYLTTARLSDDSSFIDHIAKPDLQDALTTFARNVGLSLVSGELFHKASHFLSMIFIATCCVALCDGHPESSVNAAQQEFLKASRGKCDGGAKDLAKDRQAVRWLLAEMQRQFRRGLRHRGFELFFLMGRSIQFYKYCPKEPKENNIFTKKIPCCEPPDEIQAALPLWIPFFVKLHVGKRWSYEKICEALQVNLLNREENFQHFQEIYSSRELVACRLEDNHARPPDQPRKRRRHAPKKPRHGLTAADGLSGFSFAASSEANPPVTESASTTRFRPINADPQDQSSEQDIESNGPNRHGSEFSDHSMPAGDGAAVGWIQDTGTGAIGEAAQRMPVQTGTNGSLPPAAFRQVVSPDYGKR